MKAFVLILLLCWSGVGYSTNLLSIIKRSALRASAGTLSKQSTALLATAIISTAVAGHADAEGFRVYGGIGSAFLSQDSGAYDITPPPRDSLTGAVVYNNSPKINDSTTTGLFGVGGRPVKNSSAELKLLFLANFFKEEPGYRAAPYGENVSLILGLTGQIFAVNFFSDDMFTWGYDGLQYDLSVQAGISYNTFGISHRFLGDTGGRWIFEDDIEVASSRYSSAGLMFQVDFNPFRKNFDEVDVDVGLSYIASYSGKEAYYHGMCLTLNCLGP